MVKKFNLSEAAADILNQSVTSKRSGQDAPGRLPTSVAYGTKEVGDIGTQVTKTTDAGPNATKGVPRATAPGATPPVGSQPFAKLKSQPGQEDGDIEQPEGKKGVQKMQKNTGATFQQYEETETDEDLVYEEKEEDGEHEDEKEDKAMMKKILKGKREKMQEDLDAMLQGENLSEEFVAKASTIFEAAVMSRVQEIVEEVEGQLEEQFEATIEEMKEDFATKIDDYLNYMVEEWIKENEIAIETGLRAEIVEDFIGGLRNLFTEHYIDIPEEKVNVVEELASKVEELEARLNEEINRSVDFKKEINEHKKNQAIQTVCEGLTQTQVEKLKSLAESVEFTSEYEFADKLGTLKEAYTPSTAKSATKSALEEGVEVEEDTTTMKKSHDSLVDAVARTISKSVVR
jgi:hypothetical protein